MIRNSRSYYVPEVDFTQADLLANSEGKLTPYQDELVESVYQTRQRGARQTTFAFLIFYVILIVVGGLIELNQSGRSLPDLVTGTKNGLIAMIAIFLLILSISLVSNWIVSHDAKTRHISTIEGTAYPLVAEASFRGTRYMRYELRIKKGRLTRKLFRFSSERSPRQFTEGRTYRIYYINFYPFDIILSAEEL